MLADRDQRLRVPVHRRRRPWLDRTLGHRLGGVRHDQLRVHQHLLAQAVAGRAGAIGIVEREQPGLDLGQREARDRAGELGRHGQPLAAVGVLGDAQAIREAERRLDRFGQALGEVGRGHHAVDHDLDLVLTLLVQRRHVVQVVELAVDPDPLEALPQQVAELLAILALAAAHDRRQQEQARALGHLQQPVDHLRDRLRLDRQAGRGRIGDADPRPEQAHVVVDLGHRRHGRARILRGRLLLDRDRRRQAGDQVHVGLLHQLQELARVGRQALDIAPLSLGIDRVEGEARLARARQPGDHHQPVARDVDVDALEIVLARAANPNEVIHAIGSIGTGVRGL